MKHFLRLSVLLIFLFIFIIISQALSTPTFLFKFGVSGTALGQLDSPHSLAVASNGNIYIAEGAENQRISVFNSAGAYLFSWGGLGGTTGLFNNTTGVAIDATGRVFVTDSSSHNVEAFDLNGNFLFQFGTFGVNPGQISGPTDITVGPDGLLYISDQASNFISVFNRDGNYITRFGGTSVFDTPTEIDFDSTGRIYIVDQSLSKVVVYSPSYTFLYQFGSFGSSAGQFWVPIGIAIDTNDNVYVADFRNDRVQVFNTAGSFLLQFGGLGTANGKFDGPSGVEFDPATNRLYVTDTVLDRVQAFQLEAPANNPPTAVTDTVITDEDMPVTIDVLANDFDTDGNLNVSSLHVLINAAHGTLINNGNGTFTYTPNTDYVGSDTFSYEICDTGALCATGGVSITVRNSIPTPATPSLLFIIGQSGFEPGEFDFITGVDVASNTNVYILDNGSQTNRNVQVFDSNGNFLFLWGEAGTGPNFFNSPISLTIDQFDRVIVGDNSDNNLEYYSREGNYLFTFKPFTDHTVGLDFNTLTGNLFFLDRNNDNVLVVDSNQNILSQFGNSTTLRTPRAAAVTSNGNIYIIDSERLKIVVFDAAYNFLFEFGSSGNAAGQFNTPLGIAADSQDYLYVTDARNDRIQVFDTRGNYLLEFARAEMSFPDNIDFDPLLNRLYVTDNVLDQVFVYSVGEPSIVPPVANDDIALTSEDTNISINVGANDSDSDSGLDLESITLLTSPLSGIASVASGGFIDYTPHPNSFGNDSFSYQICDITGLCDTATVTVTVNPVNDAPIAIEQSLTVNEDGSLAIILTATDIEADGLIFTLLNTPTNGTFSGTAPNLIYTPSPNFNGSDSFTFKANDGFSDSNVATVAITVNPVNDAPIAIGQNLSVNEDNSLTIALTATDIEPDSLGFTILSNPANGTLSGTAPNLTYTPSPNFNGSDSFTFKASDGFADSNVATVNITINPINDAPITIGQSLSVNEDNNLTISLIASDVDGDVVSYTLLSNPTNGTISGVVPNLVYVPNSNFFGADSFTFKVNDGFADSNVATVNITINPINDAPSCNMAVSSIDFLWPANGDMISVNILGVTDIEGDSINIQINSILQDEPTSGMGNNDLSPDGAGIGTAVALIRAERNGNGNGRMYHIFFTATDTMNATCSGEILVGVLHDQGPKGQAVDDGALFNSTQP